MKEFSAMFCDLKGATSSPRSRKMRQSAVTSRLLPAPDPVPWIISALDMRPPVEQFHYRVVVVKVDDIHCRVVLLDAEDLIQRHIHYMTEDDPVDSAMRGYRNLIISAVVQQYQFQRT